MPARMGGVGRLQSRVLLEVVSSVEILDEPGIRSVRGAGETLNDWYAGGS